MKQRYLYHYFLPLFLFIIVSCGETSSSPQPEFQPIRPDPTSTVKAASVSTAPGQPTSIVSNQVNLARFVHPTQRFGISYPENWQPFERPDGVVFIDPGNHAGYGAFFNDVGQVYSAKELNQYMVTFVTKNFIGKEADFAPLKQEQKADGSIMTQFSSKDPNLGQAINEVRVSQKDTIVFVLYLSATEEQWQISQEQLQHLADTFTIMNTKPGTATPPAQEPPQWVLIGPTNSTFAFFYPSDWQVLRQDESTVTVGMPDTDVVFEATVSDAATAKDNAEAAKKAGQAYVDQLAKDYKDVQSRPPEKFQLDQVADGATIDFLYTAADGTVKAGSIITTVSEGQLYQVVFSASAKTYQAALQWFNPMYKSFRILPTEDIVPEDQKPK